MEECGMERKNELAYGPWVGGLLTIVIGLPYATHALGSTEVEVMQWGRTCITLGLLLLVATLVKSRVSVWLQVVSLLVIAAIQLPPAFLWLLFHGTGISDGAPPSTFVAHWGWAIPHCIVLLTSTWLALRLAHHLSAREMAVR